MRKALRILQFVAVFMVYLIMTMTIASAVSFSHDPSDVIVDGNGAIIQWSTDEDATAGLRYGAASPPTETVMGTDIGQEHEVTLSGLEYDTDYFYSLIAQISGADEVDDNGGSYYRFTTGSDPSLEMESDGEGDGTPDYSPTSRTTESGATPFISATIPRYVHQRRVSIVGRTAPRATVRIYLNVNEGAVGGVSYDLVTTTNEDGEFSFPRVPLSQDENVVYLWARSLSGEEGHVRYEITVDNDVPIVEGDLPDVSNSTTLHYTGTVSEDVTINVTIGDNSDASAHRAGPFDVEIQLEDMALQEVMVTFTDGAGNMVVKRSTIFASTQDPVIYRTNLASINPSYVRDVTITGNVTPRSYVVVFVNGQTSPDSSWPTSVRDIIANFGTIISGNQYGTYTEDGLFQIPILLSQQATTERRVVTAGSPGTTSASQIESELARERGYPTSFGGYGSTRADLRGEYGNQIEVLVISRTGRTTSSGPQAVQYTKCGFGGDYQVDISEVTPSIIIPEHLRRGMARLGFSLTMQWRGSARELTQASVRIRPYKLSEEERRQYAIDPEDLISPSSPITARRGADGRTYSVLMELNTINYTQAEFDDLDLEDLRIKIPLMIELNYMTETSPNCVPGQEITCSENRIQRECFDINTALDIQIPSSAVPEDLLTWSITALNDTINVIDSILEPLQLITQITFYVCLASWVVLFITKVMEKYTCLTQGENDPDCISAKGTTRDVDYGMRWICDRVFCPAAPNFAKWASEQVAGTGPKGITSGPSEGPESTKELCSKVLSGSGGTSGSTVTLGRTSPTTGGSTGPRGVGVIEEFYNQDASWENFPLETCADEYVHQWETSCLLMDELGESRCQKARAEEDEDKQREFCGNFLEQTFRAATSLCKADEINQFQAVSPVDRNRYEFRRPSWYGQPEAMVQIETRTGLETGQTQTTRVQTQAEGYTRLLAGEEVQRLQLSVQQREDYVINPTEDLFAALRCVCLPAIQGYLQLWRNILEAIKQCFQTVLAGGDATSGMCRAVLTTYLCDFIFSAISCFVNAFGAGTGDSASGESERGIGAFFQALRGAGSDIQSSVQSRYGASNLYRSMFTERRLVHAICLFAFTGDWDLDLDTALGGLGSIPLRSEGFIYPATRRFISSDPNNQGRTTHIYHIGAGLVAGDNIDFRLELVCSANTLCNPDDGFIGGECDCFRSGREQTFDITRELGSGRLSAGDILGRTEGDIYALIQNAPMRYDKVRMRWRSQRQSEATVRLDSSVEQPIGQIGGNSPVDCGYNVGLGEYRCSFDVGVRGYAMFRTEPQSVKAQLNVQGQIIPGTSAAPFVLGETMDLNFEVAKQSPNYDPRSATRDPANEIPFFLTYRVKRGSQYIPITNSPEPGQGTDTGLVRIARDGLMAFPRDAHVPGLVVSPAMFSAFGASTGVTTRSYPISGGGLRTELESIPNTVGATEQETQFYVRFVEDGSNVRYQMGSVSNYHSQGRESTMDTGDVEVTGIVSQLGVPLDKNYRGILITPRRISGQQTVNDLLNNAAVYLYQRPGTTSAQGCDSQDPVTFTIEMELKYPTTRERADRSAPTEEDFEQGRVRITPTNAIPSLETVRDPAGQLQRKTVQVQAICRDRPAVNPCIANTRVGAECECGSGSTAQMCSPTDANINYCQEDGGVYSCVAYNSCEPRNRVTIPESARAALTEQNWCDCDGPSADANGRMECGRGASCNEITGSGNWVCSNPRTFALGASPGVATGAASCYPFRFAVISDMNYNSPSMDRLYTQTVIPRLIDDIRPKLLFMTGDLVGGTPDKTTEQMLGAFGNFGDSVRRLQEGGIAVFLSRGNHDMFPQGAGLYESTFRGLSNADISLASGNANSYHSFNYCNNNFIVTNTPGRNPEPAQLTWLEEEVARPADNTFAFGHKPARGLIQSRASSRLSDEAVTIMTGGGVEAYFAGHDHVFADVTERGLRYVSTGTSSGDRRILIGESERQAHSMVVVDVRGPNDFTVYGVRGDDFRTTWDGTALPPTPQGTVRTGASSITGAATTLPGNPIFNDVTHQEQRILDSDVNIIRARQAAISLVATAQVDKSQPTSRWAQSKDMEVAINGDFNCRGERVPRGHAASGGRVWLESCGDDDAGGVGVDSLGRITILTPSQMTPSIISSMQELVSGQPLLLDNGVVQQFMSIGYCASNPGICERSPRTAVGLSADGTLLMVSVDGGTSTSRGMTLTELAEYMRSLGAVRALNMGGGGSTTMFIEGRGVVNNPSVGREQTVINHLGINAQDLGTALVGSASRVPGVPPTTGTAGRIMLFGHSLVESATAPLVIELQDELGVSIDAGGRRGWSIVRWLNAGDASEVVRGYGTVFVVLNNQRRRINSADLVRLDRELKAFGANVVWIGDSPRPADNPYDGTEEYQWNALRAAASQGVTYVLAEDWPMPSSGYTSITGRDEGLHVTRSGARLWANRLGPLLRPHLPRISSVPDVGPGRPGSVTTFRRTSCDGLADSSAPFEAYFTSYHTPSYGSSDGYSAPWTITSGSGRTHARGYQLSGNAPGTDAPWSFFCAVAMECSCPSNPDGNRYDATKRCYAGGQWRYGASRNGWTPCTPFPQGRPYCTSTASGRAPVAGQSVAADKDCFDVRSGCMISIDGGPPREITDTGSGIRGLRFDAYSTEARGPGDGRVNGVHTVQILNPSVCRQRAPYRGGIP